MKKYILALTVAAAALGASASVDHPNRLIVHTTSGQTTVLALGEVDYVDFDEVSDLTVALSVKEGALGQTSFTIVAEPGAGCASYTLALAGSDAEPASYAGAAEVVFGDLEPGTTYEVTATPADIYGIAGEATSITVTTVSDLPAPKVGDYFYSDGTWSDGGLISMNPDGTNAVWADEKPAPIEGKTVVGIVFCTDPDRMDAADKADGFTRGYVIGCKNIQDPKKANFAKYPESVWFTAANTPSYIKVEVNKVAKIASSCFQRINGREETQKLIAANDPAYLSEDIPMFYYGTTGYPVAAPEGTSGWFIPAVGQVWDCVANFCGGSVAEYLASIRTSSSDFTYYCSTTCTEVPLDAFMKVFALVPDADKDEMTIADEGVAGSEMISLGTSTRYDSESRLILNLGMNGNTAFEGMANWFDGEAHARPILAF